ncbi:MAG: SDR family oxidoreductase, partial [Actinobacteria bacterium]|nr:SDR family oxidoreductase [Actinomycetota bacterium]
MSNRPVALVSDTRYYVGPDLARRFAEKGFDLVLGDPSPNLVSELESMGARIVPVTGHSDLSSPESAQAQADAALATFGRLDSAVMFSGQIVTGRFVNSTIDQLRQ